MKILLLGSEGMLGSELFAILKLNPEVAGKDIQDFGIAPADDCRRLVAEIHPDVVINAVAYADVDGCEGNQDKCFAVNPEKDIFRNYPVISFLSGLRGFMAPGGKIS